jgi:hypothetical protein
MSWIATEVALALAASGVVGAVDPPTVWRAVQDHRLGATGALVRMLEGSWAIASVGIAAALAAGGLAVGAFSPAHRVKVFR